MFAGRDARLTAVGDTKQRIMRFAGALKGIYARYAADFDAEPLNLYQNYRSQPVLRRMQNRMVAVIEPSAVPQASIEGDDGDIDTVEAADEFDEARRVTQIVAGDRERAAARPCRSPWSSPSSSTSMPQP